MENYVFELEGGVFGFFQRNEEDCFLYINSGLLSRVYYYRWSQWLQGENNYNEVFPDAINLNETYKAIGYFSWHQLYDRCPYTPIVINASKKLQSGIYYPRINRGEPGIFNQQSIEPKIFDEIRSFSNILDSLNLIFNYIDPDIGNLQCFGSKIRELLIIACTEVEYLLQNFLADNKYMPDKDRFSTKDYVKSLNLLKLNEYSVSLDFYPNLKNWSPFKDWDENRPTASLDWYDAYNAVKHNRGANKNKASLEAVINAVAAIHILLVSQYGNDIFNNPLKSNFHSIFNTTSVPKFLVSELECPCMGHDKLYWDRKSYLFT